MLKRWCWVVVEEEKSGCEEGLIAESRGGDVFVLVVSQTFFEKNDTCYCKVSSAFGVGDIVIVLYHQDYTQVEGSNVF